MDILIENKLKRYARLDNEDDVIRFDEVLETISESSDPRYIPLLMSVFDDGTKFPDVMYNVIHVLESYPDDIYVIGFINNIPRLLEDSPDWLLNMTYAIFNHSPSYSVFKKNVHLISPEFLLKFLDLVARESEIHKPLCEEIRKEALTSNL